MMRGFSSLNKRIKTFQTPRWIYRLYVCSQLRDIQADLDIHIKKRNTSQVILLKDT
jgi:hypothetical protein